MGMRVHYSENWSRMETEISLCVRGVEIELAEALAASINEGEALMKQVIETSETRTGLNRVALGGNGPGRVDTGTMLDGTGTEMTIEGNSIHGRMGWGIHADTEEYFLYQENGTRTVEAMHALLQGFILARERLIPRILKAIRGHR